MRDAQAPAPTELPKQRPNYGINPHEVAPQPRGLGEVGPPPVEVPDKPKPEPKTTRRRAKVSDDRSGKGLGVKPDDGPYGGNSVPPEMAPRDEPDPTGQVQPLGKK
jgi:hypothetical protein